MAPTWSHPLWTRSAECSHLCTLILEKRPLSRLLARFVPQFLMPEVTGPVVLIDAYMFIDKDGSIVSQLPDDYDDYGDIDPSLAESHFLVCFWLDLCHLEAGAHCAFSASDGEFLVSSSQESITLLDGPCLKTVDGVSGMMIEEWSLNASLRGARWLLSEGSKVVAITRHDHAHIVDSANGHVQDLGHLGKVLSARIDPRGNKKALLFKENGSKRVVSSLNLETGMEGFHFLVESPELVGGLSYLCDGMILALACCQYATANEDSEDDLDWSSGETCLRLLDTTSGDEVMQHSCLKSWLRYPVGSSHLPSLRKFESFRSGTSLAAFGFDFQGDGWLEIINLNSDMSLRNRRELCNLYDYTDDFSRFGCSSLAVVNGSAGIEVLLESNGRLWSFCADSGNPLWKVGFFGHCTVNAIVPLGGPAVHRVDSLATMMETLNSHHHHTMDDILHIDPPTCMFEAEAADVVAVQHADFVQRLCETVQNADDSLWLGKLNRIPKALRTELSGGKSLRLCRTALEAAGYHYKIHDSGAFISVHPDQYKAAMDAVFGRKLFPDHVLFTTSFEPMLEEALEKGGALESRAWMKSRDSLTLMSELDPQSCMAEMDDESLPIDATDNMVVVVQRTFISLLPACARDDESVLTESTSKIHCSTSPNPRGAFRNSRGASGNTYQLLD